ncbi:DHA2 family efflux MFS transporter permease subunit [Bradyrhizobium sp.]|uniref:DHA2 family efflux MFS transporter permease subunit n=1 Tax=Bradyrhizobium sp. TaxID=376 RepID=UPI003C536F07
MTQDTAQAGNRRGTITLLVLLAAMMQTLDTTIVNVALPYVQGSVATSPDQIDWVLTAYITAAAIMTPPTGFLVARFGLKRLFIVSTVGFTLASMLCGLAESLTQIVIFRIVQGAFGAAMIPLSQTVLLTIYPKERHGFAMALFGLGVVVGPVLGPVLGGWLTQDYTWRYVFYINGPLGIIASLGMMVFLPESPRSGPQKFDWFGFGTLSLAIGALQVLLDRGEIKDWFGSSEIVIEALVAGSAFYLFLVHTFTAQRPFIRPALFRDRNFAAGVIFSIVAFITLYASLALQPPYLQDLMNYPVLTAGLVMGPRGVGTMIATLIVGRFVGKVDTRLLLAVGLGLSAWAFYVMTGWTPDVSGQAVVTAGLVQGAGFGALFVPMSAVTLSTLAPEDRADGASIFSLSRSLGSSVGISAFTALLTTNTEINHADISANVTAVNRAFEDPTVTQFLSPFTAAGRAALDALVTQQAQVVAYIDDYKLLLLATLALFLLLLIFKKTSGSAGHAAAVEG